MSSQDVIKHIGSILQGQSDSSEGWKNTLNKIVKLSLFKRRCLKVRLYELEDNDLRWKMRDC